MFCLPFCRNSPMCFFSLSFFLFSVSHTLVSSSIPERITRACRASLNSFVLIPWGERDEDEDDEDAFARCGGGGGGGAGGCSGGGLGVVVAAAAAVAAVAVARLRPSCLVGGEAGFASSSNSLSLLQLHLELPPSLELGAAKRGMDGILKTRKGSTEKMLVVFPGFEFFYIFSLLLKPLRRPPKHSGELLSQPRPHLVSVAVVYPSRRIGRR